MFCTFACFAIGCVLFYNRDKQKNTAVSSAAWLDACRHMWCGGSKTSLCTGRQACCNSAASWHTNLKLPCCGDTRPHHLLTLSPGSCRQNSMTSKRFFPATCVCVDWPAVYKLWSCLWALLVSPQFANSHMGE